MSRGTRKTGGKTEEKGRYSKEVEEIVDGLTLFDDNLMSRVFDKRARYHSSMMDSRMLKKGQDFSEIKNSYVIFIYRHDKFGLGLPVYHIKRTVTESGEAFGDGSEIIYVNGAYTGDDSISQLIADFRQIGRAHV